MHSLGELGARPARVVRKESAIGCGYVTRKRIAKITTPRRCNRRFSLVLWRLGGLDRGRPYAPRRGRYSDPRCPSLFAGRVLFQKNPALRSRPYVTKRSETSNPTP